MIDNAIARLRRCCTSEEIADWFGEHAAMLSTTFRVAAPAKFSVNWLARIGKTHKWKFHLWMSSPHDQCQDFIECILPAIGFEVLWSSFGTRYQHGSDCFVAFDEADFQVLTFCEKLKQ